MHEKVNLQARSYREKWGKGNTTLWQTVPEMRNRPMGNLI